jgi:hypothetical protein
MLHLNDISRIKAFLIHLGISLFIFSILLYLILFEWYPFPYFQTDGGWQGIRIIIGVDVVLGPLLTLIVFKPGKPKLKLDLSIIAALQSAALIWGIYIVYTEKPVAAIFTENYFTSIPLKEFKRAGMTEKDLKKFGSSLPVLIYSNLPKSQNELQALRIKALGQQRPLYLFSEYYEKFSPEYIEDLKANKIPRETLLKIYPEYKNEIAETNKGVIYTALYGRYERKVVQFDTGSLTFKKSIDINPWPILKNR